MTEIYDEWWERVNVLMEELEGTAVKINLERWYFIISYEFDYYQDELRQRHENLSSGLQEKFYLILAEIDFQYQLLAARAMRSEQVLWSLFNFLKDLPGRLGVILANLSNPPISG